MISKTESVWRYLLAAALERDERRQPSITAIASELGLGVSTVHKALERPTTIGAVVVHPSRGVRVIDPWRLLVLWAGKRNLENDVLCRSTSALSPDQIERRVQESDAVLSGFGGIVSHLGVIRSPRMTRLSTTARRWRTSARTPTARHGFSSSSRIRCWGDTGGWPRLPNVMSTCSIFPAGKRLASWPR